ncbi:MAG: zinc ribbon domain-containing protein [Acidobacteria bacterium]|jgi:putative FmdB family regulatory protein|nr:zinc ribbon domain-containing protein [Acidobacteriota bacterium]
MPLYEYQCDACGNRFERIRKFSDPPLEDPCGECGGHVTKLISSPAIQFKGKGWYVTDYAKSGSTGDSKTVAATSEASADAKSDARKKDASAEGKSDTKSETKTETKAETKTETKTDAKSESAAKPKVP